MIRAVSELGSAPDVLIVDDNEDNRLLLRTYLTAQGYRVKEAADGMSAIEMVQEQVPDLVLLDVLMPGMDGYQVCQRLRGLPGGRLLPIIVVTELSEGSDKVTAADAGADDFISKPINGLEVRTRVRSLLRIKLLTDALDGAENTIVAIARALEARDPYTCGHSDRVGLYGARLAALAGQSLAEQEALQLAGRLHDVGKIGIRDSTLQKPGPLDEAQWVEMRTHPIIGFEICQPLRSLQGQLLSIRHHHERWDGGGYPDGLQGEAIPFGARVTAVCDSWDAMTSDRVYRPGMRHNIALAILEQGRGTQWDPDLTELFLAYHREITAAEEPALSLAS